MESQRRLSRVFAWCLFVLGTTAFPVGAQSPGPLTLFCSVVGGNTVIADTDMAVECFVRNDSGGLLGIRPGQFDLPCSLPAGPSAAGAIVAFGGTTDPDGDGLRGPSSAGIPYLYGTTAIGVYHSADCTTFEVGDMNPPASLAAGGVRYLGTVYYHVEPCSVNDFHIRFECADQPDDSCDSMPEATNTTRYRDDSVGMGQLISLNPSSTVISVQPGACDAPTISPWGLVFLSLVLLLVAVILIRRRVASESEVGTGRAVHR